MENSKEKSIRTSVIDFVISKRITSLRFFLTVLVVFIHANLTVDNAINYYHYDFIQPKWIEVFKNFVCNTIGGAAVPLFFFFASYLQFSKNDSYPVLLKKKAKSLFVPYVLWTVITIFLFFAAQSVPQTAPFFQNPINIVKNWNFFDWIKVFTYHNLEENLKTPFVYQFWFVRELIIFIILSPIFKFLCRKLPGMVLFFVSICMLKGIPVFFTVSSGALFYYLAGYYCAEYKVDFFKLADKLKIYEYLILIALSVIFSLAFDGKYNFDSISVFITCLFFLKVSYYLAENEKIYRILNYLSGFSFWLYAVHAPFLSSVINKLSQRVIPLHGILCLFQFLLAAFLTIAIGLGLGILLKKICPKLFTLLTGGRG